jgi:protein O-mannosyl-transferase
VFYPDAADGLTIGIVALSAVAVIGMSVLIFWQAKTWPYLLVGWCWYLVALLPVIGLVQVGLQGRADRYTYLPQIGLCVSIVWALAQLPVMNRRGWQLVAGVVTAAAIAALARQGAIQTSYWQNTESLWRHALAVTENNDLAHYNVASLLMSRGQVDDAIKHYIEALRVGSGRETHNHLSPAIVENSLGNALARKRDLDSAILHYRNAIELRTDFTDARTNLATILIRKGRIAEAISEYEKAVTFPPEDVILHQQLAALLIQANRPREAVAHYRRAVEIAPDSLDPLNALAWMLATASDPGLKDGPEALSLATHANSLTGGKDPVVLRILAAAHYSCGQSTEAIAAAEQAVTLARNNPTLTGALQAEIKVYSAQ